MAKMQVLPLGLIKYFENHIGQKGVRSENKRHIFRFSCILQNASMHWEC